MWDNLYVDQVGHEVGVRVSSTAQEVPCCAATRGTPAFALLEQWITLWIAQPKLGAARLFRSLGADAAS